MHDYKGITAGWQTVLSVQGNLKEKQKEIEKCEDTEKINQTFDKVNKNRVGVEAERSFFGGIFMTALRFLPNILDGLAAGWGEYHTEGNGMFLGRRNQTYQIRFSSEELHNILKTIISDLR